MERSFLDISRQREAAEQGSRRRRVRLTVAGLSVALIIITGLAALAVVQRNQARQQRDSALSRQIAANATAQLSVDPELSLLLARRAFAVSPTPEAASVLRQATSDSRVRTTLRGNGAS
jgi:hypothetical protein